MKKCNDDDDDYQYILAKNLCCCCCCFVVFTISRYTQWQMICLFVCWSWYNSIGEYSVCVCVGVCGERERERELINLKKRQEFLGKEKQKKRTLKNF